MHPLPPCHHHPDPLSTLTPTLLQHLPYSLPLLRRLQFTHSSSDARVFSTIPPNAQHTNLTLFAAAYIEKSRFPETQCWLFSSYETSPQESPLINDPAAAHHEARLQILALLHAIAQLPPSPHLNDSEKQQVLILGCLSTLLVPLLAASALPSLQTTPVISRDPLPTPPSTLVDFDNANVLTGISVPYVKYVTPPPSEGEGLGVTLPSGYIFTELRQEEEFELVISRTKIPRTVRGLRELGNVGILSKPEGKKDDSDDGDGGGDLVAWAFLSPDGSLASLHVEPEHRGKGLAKIICRRLFSRLKTTPEAVGFEPLPAVSRVGERGDGSGAEKGGRAGCGEGDWSDIMEAKAEGWTHSDVAEDNIESAGVARAVGGREGWRVRWVGVDLGRVEEVVRAMGARNTRVE